ncbi:hypothetical protein [Halomarina ordinaria]|uniref:Uncharacterized protein n=1 Tax=Halomarina ordinaria TaxID=3033939 RepID=A0ABD5UG03_9EURY|nr:hypothetical protein [Halomarina sp. PSRA2]
MVLGTLLNLFFDFIFIVIAVYVGAYLALANFHYTSEPDSTASTGDTPPETRDE